MYIEESCEEYLRECVSTTESVMSKHDKQLNEDNYCFTKRVDKTESAMSKHDQQLNENNYCLTECRV